MLNKKGRLNGLPFFYGLKALVFKFISDIVAIANCKLFNIRPMKFPDYFITSPKHKVIIGKYGKCIEYQHQQDSVKNIYLSIEEIFYVHVIEGEIRFQSSNETIHIKKGNSAVINIGPYIMSESLSVNNRFKAYILFLPNTILEQFYNRDYNIKVNPTANEDLSNILLIEKCLILKSFIDTISLLFKGNYESRKNTNLIDLKTKELMYYLRYNSLSQDVYNMLYPSINNDFSFKKTIESHYLSNLNIIEIAFLCNMSLSNFKRKFKNVYKTTPSKWIKDKKLEYAQELMKTKKYKVKEIAYKSGFNNPTTFSRLFKSKYGFLPNIGNR